MPRSTTCAPKLPKQRPGLDIGEIFRTHAREYLRKYSLTPEQHKAMRALALCRTAALGGHLDVCTACGYERPAYNSCRNRHCPKCQSLAQAKWLDERKERILPTSYFHVVFTIPRELRAVTKQNQTELFNLLFSSSAATLNTLAKDERWLGAQIGFTSVLHTWTRKLHFHPHVHCVVTGGGLKAGGERWVACHRDFLFPINVISALFRGKFLAGLQRLYERGLLDTTRCDQLADDDAFRQLLSALYRKNWVVYVKRPFAGAEQVYAYLGRYTHRVAISNSRLIEVTDDKVHFATKQGGTMTLEPLEFMRRFLQHVLPKGFVKIRHYGLLASSNATTKLEVARELLLRRRDQERDEKPSCRDEPSHRDWRQRYEALTGHDLSLCPKCQCGTMLRQPLPDHEQVPHHNFWDSS